MDKITITLDEFDEKVHQMFDERMKDVMDENRAKGYKGGMQEFCSILKDDAVAKDYLTRLRNKLFGLKNNEEEK